MTLLSYPNGSFSNDMETYPSAPVRLFVFFGLTLITFPNPLMSKLRSAPPMSTNPLQIALPQRVLRLLDQLIQNAGSLLCRHLAGKRDIVLELLLGGAAADRSL